MESFLGNLFTVPMVLSMLFDSFPDSMYVKDSEGRFIWVNQAKAGHYMEDLAGKTDFDLLPEIEALKCRLDDQQVLRGDPVINRIEELTRPDGSKVFVSATKIPIRNDKGDIIGLIGSSKDITIDISKQKGIIDVIGSALHGTKQPLNILAGKLKLLSRKNYGPLLDESVSNSVNEAAALSMKIVKKFDETLRQLTPSGILLKNEEDIDMEEDVFFPAILEFQEMIEEKKIHLDNRLGSIGAGRAIVHGNKTLLLHVVANLLENAIKYVNFGGTIAYGYEDRINYHQFNIYDDGSSIPHELLDMIFNDTYSGSGSTGRGLSICRTIITSMGGRIWCENTEEGHPNFIFTLPK